MLYYLKIKNLALLTEIVLEFDQGFTVVTGETGAGKSILLGALGFLAGSRTDKSIIRQNASTCEVEASLFFSNVTRINLVLETLNLPPCEDNILIIKRTIDREKSPRILINGSLASLNALQTISEYWIDFHGPGEPQKLFQRGYQLQMLDLYCGLSSLVNEYSELYREWKNQLKKIQELADSGHLSQDEIHFYQSQINKINAVNPCNESIKELEQNFASIAHAQQIGLIATQIEAILREDFGIIPAIQSLIKPACELAKILPQTDTLSQRLNSLIIEAEDLACEYSALTSIDHDPEFIQETQIKMANWLDLKRQFGATLEIILKKRQSLEEKVTSQANIENVLAQLEKDSQIKKASLEKLANILQERRRESAKILANKVQNLLQSFGFPKAKLELKVHSENDLKEYGDCFVEFLFAPNIGQALMPLNKIASSGETARVMLALKTILAEIDQTPLLVFDEVDANVGGEIASKVAYELKNLSKNHQIFCVTHLPQAAAQAHNHYVVTKEVSLNNTSITITKLSDPQKRINELARMIGDRTSESALNHARELLLSH